MPVAIYTRQSFDRSKEEAGVTRQLAECRMRAGGPVDYELSDNDISATTGKARPAFERLLQLVEQGKVDTVIVWHPDRLYRRLTDLVRITEIAKEYGLNIVSVQAASIDLSTPSGRMVASILGSVSTQEGEHRTERQKLAFRQLANTGKWHFSHRPFGYTRERGAQRPDIVPEEAAILRDLYRKYYGEGASRASLVKELNAAGVKTAMGREWSITQLREVLGNERYAGINRYKGDVLGQGDWEPIITLEEWERYTGAASRRAVISTFSRTATSLLSGLVTCGVCGGKVYRRSRNDAAKSKEYTCSVKHCVSIRCEALDEGIPEMVLSALLKKIRAEDDDETQTAALAPLQAQRNEIAARRDRAQDLMLEPNMNLDRLRGQLAELSDQVEALDAQIAEVLRSDAVAEVYATARGLVDSVTDIARAQRAWTPGDIMSSIAFSEAFDTQWDVLDLADKRALVTATLRITLNKADTKYHPDPFQPVSGKPGEFVHVPGDYAPRTTIDFI